MMLRLDWVLCTNIMCTYFIIIGLGKGFKCEYYVFWLGYDWVGIGYFVSPVKGFYCLWGFWSRGTAVAAHPRYDLMPTRGFHRFDLTPTRGLC